MQAILESQARDAEAWRQRHPLHVGSLTSTVAPPPAAPTLRQAMHRKRHALASNTNGTGPILNGEHEKVHRTAKTVDEIPRKLNEKLHLVHEMIRFVRLVQ